MSDLAPAPSLRRWSERDFQVELNATPAQLLDLQSFHVLLGEWGQRMNLVGPSAMADFWLRHAYDSAQLLHVEQSALRWADVGAGAGFPGVVLAILLKGRAGGHIDLIESMEKRARFLAHVVETLALPARIHHARAEAISSPPGLQIVTARACAPLSRLFGYTAHFFRAGAAGLFLKGGGVQAELTEARLKWAFEAELLPSLSDSTGQIVRVKRLRPGG